MKGRVVIGLRGRLVSAVAATLIALLSCIAALALYRSDAALEEVDRARFEAATKQFAHAISYAVLAKSPGLLEPSIAAFAEHPELASVRVVADPGLDPIAERVGRAAGSDLVRVEVRVHTKGEIPGDARDELEIFGIEAGRARPIGKVVAEFSRHATLVLEDAMQRDVIAMFAILGLVGVLGVSFLASRVVRRIRTLADASGRVARGEFDARVDDRGADELSLLARDFNDMTRGLEEHRRALAAAATQLAEKESLAAIGRATAVIAHELRNPLGIILGASPIVANASRPPKMREQAARIIEQEVRRLEATLAQLLDHARPRTPRRARVDVLALCLDARERTTFAGGPAQGRVVEVDGTGIDAFADEQQLSQILLNLIGNSAEAGAEHIAVHVGNEGDRVVIDVSDDGCGVDPRVRDELFRPFVTSKQRGSGLGLSTSRRMARDNGGDLRRIDDDRPRGAHFRIELPVFRGEGEGS